MAAVGVFTKSILKSQTNKISVKLSLMGKILREYTPDKERIFVQGKSGIIIHCPIHSQLFKNTENIINLEEQGNIFVSEEFCEEVLFDVENLTFQKLDGFLSGFQGMPVELAGDLLCSTLGTKIIKIFVKEMRSGNFTLQEKSYHFYRLFFLREVLTGTMKSLSKDDPRMQLAQKLVNQYNSHGMFNFVYLTNKKSVLC
jgi:hypothetical protein